MEERKKEKVSWIDWFCAQPENIFFCAISKSYIQDNFNLYDIKTLFPSESSYKEALKMILDEASIRKRSSQASMETAQYLYGLIHARYIRCAAGLEAMRRKYVRGDFGTCPRYGCFDQLVLPVRSVWVLSFISSSTWHIFINLIQIGLSEETGKECVKIFCTKCQNVYSCGQESKCDVWYFLKISFPVSSYNSFCLSTLQPWTPLSLGQPSRTSSTWRTTP